MQPFVVAERVKEAYRRYIQTSFPIRRDEVRRRFEELIETDRLLWRDPYVSLSRRFAAGRAFTDLVAEGVLGEAILRAPWGFRSLFAHQAAAVRRLAGRAVPPSSTIIATGTGSGKTEAFLVPIVDHCLRQGDGAGVQAIILYPMNALANDQLKRLRVQLAGTGVTFGRYTGDTPHNERSAIEKSGFLPRPADSPSEERYYREEIQRHPPRILITNYTMLELLLVRKQEQKILHGAKPKYLVLDEVHTYTGILGAEVACLIRRLKEHAGLEPGEVVCVGTSATIQSGGGDATEERGRLLDFASRLFGEQFDDGSVIEEIHEPFRSAEGLHFGPAPDFSESDIDSFDPDDPATVRSLYSAVHGRPLESGSGLVSKDLFDAIWDRPEYLEIERVLTSPQPLSTVVDAVRRWPGRDGRGEDSLRAEITALLLLGGAAVDGTGSGEAAPRFRPKVHLQIRSLSPIHACLACEALLTDGRTECASERHAGLRRALGFGVCRSCGQDYRLAHHAPEKAGGGTKRRGRAAAGEAEARWLELSAAAPEEGESTVLYLFPGRVSEFLPDEDDDSAAGARTYAVCPRCAVAQGVDAPAVEGLFCGNPKCAGRGVEPLREFAGFLGGARCRVCLGQGRGRRPEIITPLRSGAAATVSVLTQSLLPHLRKRADDGLDEKKLLIFADSRQDTAHQAGYLRDRHQAYTQRQIVYRVLREMADEGHAVVPLCDDAGRSVLATEVVLRARRRFGESEAFDLLTPVAARSAEDAGFHEPGAVISPSEWDRAIERLRFDLAVEFTDRAKSRNSLEREGLTTVRYPELRRAAEELARDGAGLGPETLEPLLASILDYLRWNKMVDYPPFRDYLGYSAESVRRGIARPTRQTRTPVGIGRAKHSRQSAYTVKAWYTVDRAATHATAVFDLVRRTVPSFSEGELTDLIDRIVRTLQSKRYIREVEIGVLSGAYGRITTRAHQLREKWVEVGVGGERYRCGACRRVSSYRLLPLGESAGICSAFRCRGRVEKFEPDDRENFYVRFYSREEPERLYPMEHSGQLSGDERVLIENRFRKGLINALVCTPTLELGVDIGDLVALVMRNVPPTPSNYAQRAGRAGRRSRIALILSHSGQGPHDAYFFERPQEMIAGAIQPPTFELDNTVVVDRHLNSLILEKLETDLPGRWEDIRTDDGRLRDEILRPFEAELALRQGTIQSAVSRAFVRERERGGLSWLNDSYVRARIDSFLSDLKRGLEHWCVRFRAVYQELAKVRAKVRSSPAEQEREKKLNAALDVLERDQRNYPLSYLAQVGFLPRYGFPGDTVVVRDFKEREISQAAAVGIVEFAPGNFVYVAGRKLRVDRISFAGGTREDVRQNAETYRFCPQCNYVARHELDQVCVHCGETLSTGRYVRFEAARGTEVEAIGQDDEYRDRQSYDLAQYLIPEAGGRSEGELLREVDGWSLQYSRRRQVSMFNRGRRDRSDGVTEPFVVCLECGKWRAHADHEDRDDSRQGGSGHLPTCSVKAWNPRDDDRIEGALHLRADFQGDVVQIGLGGVAAFDDDWVTTLDQALRLGLALEMFVGPKEIGSFVREWRDGAVARRELVLFDTMPGGTGYLRRLIENLPLVAEKALKHLTECRCESACYKCLKEFWNQRSHERLDKRLVLATLRTWAATTGTAAKIERTPEQEFDSFLEARFFKLLEEAGLPLPLVQEVVRNPEGRYIVRADFRYESPKLVILTDGREFHARTERQIIEDLDRRNELEFAGERLLEFGYRTVIERPSEVLETVKRGLGPENLDATPSCRIEPCPLPIRASSSLFRALVDSGEGWETDRVFRSEKNISVVLDAVNESGRLCVIVVDPELWISKPNLWASDLMFHNELRLAGWRVVRVPSSRLNASDLESILSRVKRLARGSS